MHWQRDVSGRCHEGIEVGLRRLVVMPMPEVILPLAYSRSGRRAVLIKPPAGSPRIYSSDTGTL